jgi:cytosine/adenosine deaminase-related metal-dependent hydrolase
MYLINPDYLLTKNGIVRSKAILFSEKILKIDSLENIKNSEIFIKNQNIIQTIKTAKNSFLMPSLINSHVHLEFSQNKTELKYGNFVDWLFSVIQNRDNLINSCDSNCLEKNINYMLKTGTTTIGAISSYGNEIELLAKSKIRAIIFNEIIGSDESKADEIWSLFKTRLDKTEALKNNRLIPALAIHSPYSVAKKLTLKALDFAKKNKYLVSAHFAESQAEKDWLNTNSGEFLNFFKTIFNRKVSFHTSSEFLNYFNNIQTIFTHCNFATEEELQIIKNYNHSISSCPTSNRLLTNSKLNISELNKLKIDWNISTDGLSSNSDLNLFKELKNSFFIHYDNFSKDLSSFSLDLLKSVTETPAKQLKLNNGILEENRDSDFLLIELQDDFSVENMHEIPMHLILKEYPIQKIFILGEELK